MEASRSTFPDVLGDPKTSFNIFKLFYLGTFHCLQNKGKNIVACDKADANRSAELLMP